MTNSNDEKQIQLLRQRILLACASRLGGVDQLAQYLGESQEQVRDWLTGKTVPPISVVLKVADLVLGEPEAASGDEQQDEQRPRIQ